MGRGRSDVHLLTKGFTRRPSCDATTKIGVPRTRVKTQKQRLSGLSIG